MKLLAVRRLLRIQRVVIRYRLDDLILELPMLPWWLRLLGATLPWRWLPRRKLELTRGARLRLALQDLGPIFIKFGQILSTRRDLLPDDIANELAWLQDKVPPFPPELAVKRIEEQLGAKIEQVFARFEREPLASASVAQVHAARLKSGEEVVVKVIRPNLEPVIRSDIAWLFILARLAERVSSEARRLHPVEVVSDYEKTIVDELDLLREAANASQLRRNFEGSPLLYVPQVYWDWCRPKVLVMERIYGIPVTDLETLRDQRTDFKALAERGVEIFFTQVFRDSFFHADMHPGNIFVSTRAPWSPQYIAVDCGIVGSLTDEDQDYLARNLIAFFKRDYRKVAQLHIDSGWVPAETKVNDFEAAIRTVCEPIFEKPLKDISFGQVLLRLFQTARRFNMEIQPQLVLLQKTLLNIGRVDGLSREELHERMGKVAALGDRRIHHEFLELLIASGYDPFELCEFPRSVNWGDVAALWALAGEVGLPEVIQDNVAKGGGVPAGTLATVVAINAATESTSKRGMRDWYEETALDDLTGLAGESVEEHNIYSCMDSLTEDAISSIERALVEALVETYKIPLDVLLYDLTSTFLYGKMCPLGARGYSRDHRGDLKQLVLAVAVTREYGFPVKHWLYPGNTTDVTTLPRLAADFKELHGRHVLMLVFDRGALSEKNVKVLDGEKYQFLCGLKRGDTAVKEVIRAVRDGGEFELVKEAKYDGGDTGFVWGSATLAELYGKERRVVVCYSEAQMAHEVIAQKKAIHDAALALREVEGLCRERRYRHDSLVVKIHESTVGVKGFFEVEYEDVKEGFELRYGRRPSACREVRWWKADTVRWNLSS